MNSLQRPWYKELSRYHWFVFVVAALGWLFDTMDQQLFTLARTPAMQELFAGPGGAAADKAIVDTYGPWATSIFLMGWATGGLLFGVLGDRYGRAKVMMWTILVYSLFTGISAFSVTFWDFALWRFLTGLGVGGEFAVGVALVAEVMPDRARPFALGLLQALSAVGNIAAALINLGLGEYEQTLGLGTATLMGFKLSRWRVMFMIGTVPALLCIVIRARLKEPERWQTASHSDAAKRTLDLYRALFYDPVWRRRALLGVVLATSGVIGLWGIGFFAVDLNLSIFRKVFEAEARSQSESNWDRALLRSLIAEPDRFKDLKVKLKPADFISTAAENKDPAILWDAIGELTEQKREISLASVLDHLDTGNPAKNRKPQSADDRRRREDYLAGEKNASGDGGGDGAADHGAAIASNADRIAARSKAIAGRVTRWTSLTSMMLNIGAFFGIYGFSLVSHVIGRRLTFAIAFVIAGLSTAYVFLNISSTSHVFTMIPLMGFCQLSLFGGYAIYFPELFPTRLRSTGTSFCYNVGRFIAAIGPFTLGVLNSKVFHNAPEPYRYSGAVMCVVFLLGLMVLPFCPETRGQPLPD
ncbi:MAG: MFS transporter [Planctomycetes bacterium]|nr:MFS transporter [Planctomycetota bacterium]